MILLDVILLWIGAVASVASVGIYGFTQRWWRNPLGRFLIVYMLIVVLIYARSVAALLSGVHFHPGPVSIAVNGAVAALMVYQLATFTQLILAARAREPEHLMPNFHYLKENPANPYRLGRHQVHDVLDAMPERTLDHVLDLTKKPKTVRHTEHQDVFDQGNLGSCTANAALGCLVTEPYARDGVTYTEDDAVALYEQETKLDDSQIPGEYPPDDTGSTGPWSMMALERQGKIATFFHTRSARTARVALNDGPISMGSVWLESMFNVDEKGFIVVDRNSAAAGGHEYCVVAQNVDEEWVEIRNSWGDGWGTKGHAKLHLADFEWLYTQGADAVQPRLT